MKTYMYIFFAFMVNWSSFSSSAWANAETIFVFEITEEIAEPVWHNLQIERFQSYLKKVL